MEETRTGGDLGTGGVQSHIGVQPSKGEGMSGKYDAGGTTSGGTPSMDEAKQRAGQMADEARDRVGEAANQARDRMGQVADQAQERVQEVRGRAEEMMGQARNRVGGLMEQAEGSHPVRMARDNPLPALGIAFAVGFLLAGSSDSSGRLGKAKQQIKGAVMGGISAALAQELRNAIGMKDGAGGLVDSLFGNQGGGGQQNRSGGTGGAQA
jgi:ElaB/YqjD/DUF883 family membrane-anchored ribosome-binding protein